MKHRSTARLLSSLLVCAVSAFTQLQAASVSDLSFGLIDNGTAYAVTDIDANATGSLTVPSTYNGLPVTEIGDYAFRDSGITSIDLPASLTSLGTHAFFNCTSLSGTVTIPAGVTVIPDYCFMFTAITEVVFEGEVTEIGSAAFSDTDITSIDLPDSLTSLGSAAFSQTSITSIDLPGSLTSLGSFAFNNCTSLSGTVTIPAGVTVIPHDCFGSTAITEVVFEGEVTEIGEAAFYGTDITSIDLPDSITAIRDYAFEDSGISSIDLPGSLTSIGSYAFFNCTSLSGTVTIPAGVTVIPDYCFSNTAITEVVFEGAVTSIEDYAFSDTDITSLDLPDTLTSIGNEAFANCSSLSGTVTIPAGVTVIPDFCFSNTAITEVVFEGEVTEIGNWAFYGTDITSINLPDTLNSLGYYAFGHNYALERLVFRGSAPTVDRSTFYLMGRDVAGGTQIEVYESHRASFSGSPWTDYTFVEVPDPVLEAFALTSVFDAANSSLSIHSHGEPGSAGTSVTVQHRASLSAGDNWTDVPAADVSVSTNSQTGAVVRSLNVDPSTQSEGFYRLQYNP